jgi:hypothetical protein
MGNNKSGHRIQQDSIAKIHTAIEKGDDQTLKSAIKSGRFHANTIIV